MEMTKKRLEAYRSEKQEIIELRYKLHHLEAEDFTGNDVIMDYRSGFPMPQSVVGTDIGAYFARMNRLISEISRLEQRCQEVEQWIERIPDSTTRRIFRLYYEDGQGQRAIAKQLHIDRSLVSKRISNYIKNNQAGE